MHRSYIFPLVHVPAPKMGDGEGVVIASPPRSRGDRGETQKDIGDDGHTGQAWCCLVPGGGCHPSRRTGINFLELMQRLKGLVAVEVADPGRPSRSRQLVTRVIELEVDTLRQQWIRVLVPIADNRSHPTCSSSKRWHGPNKLKRQAMPTKTLTAPAL